MVFVTIFRSISITNLGQWSKYLLTTKAWIPWIGANKAIWEQGPGVPCCIMSEVSLRVFGSWGDWWALGGKVRLSGQFLLGGLDVAALHQLQVDNILTDTRVSLGVTTKHQAVLEFPHGWLFSRLNNLSYFNLTLTVFTFSKFKPLYRFPNKPFKMCSVKIRLGQPSKLDLSSTGKKDKEQSTNQEGGEGAVTSVTHIHPHSLAAPSSVSQSHPLSL